jgi:hypothetical protein
MTRSVAALALAGLAACYNPVNESRACGTDEVTDCQSCAEGGP